MNYNWEIGRIWSTNVPKSQPTHLGPHLCPHSSWNLVLLYLTAKLSALTTIPHNGLWIDWAKKSWTWADWFWLLFHIFGCNPFLWQGIACFRKYILVNWGDTFTWLAFYVESIYQPSKLQGFCILSSWPLLHFCSLAHNWHTLGDLWLFCSLWWFLALN